MSCCSRSPPLVPGIDAIFAVNKFTDEARDSEAAQNLHNKAQEIKSSGM